MRVPEIPAKFKILLVAVLAAVALAAGAVYSVAFRNPAAADSDGSALASARTASEVGGEGTPEYNRLIDEQNSERAAAARASGGSYVAVPAGGGYAAQPPSAPSPLVRGAQPPAGAARREARPSPPMRERPPAARETGRPAAGRPAAAAPRPAAAPEDRALAADLKGILEAAGRRGAPSVSVTPAEARPTPSPEAGPAAAPAAPPGLSPGTVLYAVLDLALDSDSPSPVLATVAEGPLRGSKALGAFKATAGGLSIAFDRIVLPDGRETRVEAVGVDPDSSAPGVRSRTDTHFWERWGSLAAASFIEGLGGAVSGRRTRVYVSGDAVVEEGVGKTAADIALEAAGKVGERAASQVERGFDRPPTVTVRAGEHVGILILSAG